MSDCVWLAIGVSFGFSMSWLWMATERMRKIMVERANEMVNTEEFRKQMMEELRRRRDD